MDEKKPKENGMEKLAAFIVDKRNLIFLLYVFALIFSIVAMDWVNVENDITTYLGEDTETRQGLTVMNDNFTTFGTARIMISNITYAKAEALVDQIEAVDGVDSVEFDGTTDHYKDASALYTVTFDGEEMDDISIHALHQIEDMLSDYDLYVDTSVGVDSSADLAAEMGSILAIAAIFSFVVPKLVESIQTFALNLGGYLANVQGWYNDIIAYFHLDVEALDLSGLNDVLKNLFNYVLGFLSDLGPHLLELTSGIVSMVVTGVLSLVFSIYMLSGRDTLMSQCRRVLRAYVPARFADPLTDVVHLTADTFTRFVTGQLIEACILGGLCAAGMLFIQADYAPLIGVIIGASAIIPVAGAYIGAIVSALLLVMVSPIKALVFLVFLVVLQQIEGNVIYPKVVGTSIGLPGIWVLAAVTIGGGVGGLVGVLLSVPVASVLYALLRRDVHKRLACKE